MSAEIDNPQIALARVDGLLNKVFAVAVLLLTIDVFQNAMRQVQYLNPLWFWTTLPALLISVTGLLVSAFFIGKSRYWYRALVLVVLFTSLTWGFQMRHDEVLPPDFKPWIWWALGYAVIAAAGAWSKKWVYLALVIAPVLWVIVVTSPAGGGASLFTAIQDSLYTFFFTVAISLLVLELRDRASQLDSENNLVMQAALERVHLEAIRIERAHLNSMLLDRCIAALHSASQALNSKQKSKAIALADEAIGRLEREMSRGAMPPEAFRIDAIIPPLENAIYNRSPDCKVIVRGKTELQLSYHLAAGLYEATLLAVTNSLAHAPSANERRVQLSLSSRGIKIVVSDNGSGFRVSSVHKTALGVRWAIFRRLESLGVKVNLDTKLGVGTTWVFEWYP